MHSAKSAEECVMEPFDLIRFLARCFQIVGVAVAVFSLSIVRSDPAHGSAFIVAGVVAWFVGSRMYGWAVDNDPTAPPFFSRAHYSSAPANKTTERDWLGRDGKVVSALRPSGCVEIDGQHLEVWSEHGQIPTGATVRIVAHNGKRLVARAREPSDDECDT
jgi:membrane-bound ClpP family serine protease